MNPYESLKIKLRGRQPVSIGNIMLLSGPYLLDAFSAFDCVLLDKEHGIYDTESLLPMLTHCRNIGLPTLVRVENSLYHLIAKAIDMGADGIMLPRTETVEQVRCAVEAMHFYPEGKTGFGGYGLFRKGETMEEFQQNRTLILQIESREGLENMPAMVEAYGRYIDGFMIGPNDYSIMIGHPCDHAHPEMTAEIERVFRTAAQHGKSVGCFAPGREQALRYREMGANLFWIADDASYIREGIRSYLEGLGLNL